MGDIKVTEVNYDQYSHAIKDIVQDVFYDEFGYCSGRYKGDKFDKYSGHIVALDDYNVVGYIRAIKPNPLGFPGLEIVEPTNPLDLDECVEFSRLIIRKEYRDQPNRVAFHLWLEALKYTGVNGLYNIIVDTFIKNEMYDFYRAIGFEECSRVYNDTRFLVDGFSVLMSLNVPELMKRFLIHQQIYQNIGLDDQWISDYLGKYERRRREAVLAESSRSTENLPDAIISGTSH